MESHKKSRLIIVDDSPFVLRGVKKALKKGAPEIEAFYGATVKEGCELFDQHEAEAFISDIVLPDGTGLDVLEHIRKRDPDFPVIMMTGDPSLDTVIQAIQLGAYNYITKPFSDDYFLRLARQAIRYTIVLRENKLYHESLEKLVKERTEQLETAHRKIQQEETVRRRLITLAAHEIRTPVTSLVGMVQLVAMQNPEDKAVAILSSSSKRVSRLLNTVIPQMESKDSEYRLTLENFDIKELLDQTTEEFSIFCKEKSLVLNVDFDPGTIYSDREKVNQVIMNILLNAIKYSPVGGSIEFTGALKKHDEGDRYKVSVSDQGPGIKLEHCDHIYDRLTGFDDVNKYSSKYNFDKSYGLGMGLYLAKKFAETVSGTVGYVPGESGGSVFEFEFPCHCTRTSLSKETLLSF